MQCSIAMKQKALNSYAKESRAVWSEQRREDVNNCNIT